MNKEKEMNKGKGNRQQKKGQRTGKGTYNRKGGKDQDKIREPKQDSETKQNPRQDPKVAGDKYRNLRTFYSVCLTLN